MGIEESRIAKHMQKLNGSAIRDIFHLLGKPGMISFAGGNPALRALEPDVVKQLACEAIDTYGANILQYGATEGLAALPAEMAKFYETEGIRATSAQILPTQGSQQALDLMCKALVDPGDAVLVEAPTFLGALQTIQTYNAKLVAVETDENGVIPEAAEEAMRKYHPKLMYVIPTFQNPTGRTLSLERRKPLAELAAKYGVVLAEDDPYRDVRFAGTPLPPIKTFDTENMVVYMGSFSKLISPGLRVGCAIVTDEVLMRKLVIGKQSTDVHSPLLTQAIIALYLKKGLMPAHLERICAMYKGQLTLMLEKLDELGDAVRHSTPEGGLFVWAELPETVNLTALLPEAVGQNVAYVPGTHFYFEGGHDNTMRLNFSNSEISQIEEGMTRLNRLIRSKL